MHFEEEIFINELSSVKFKLITGIAPVVTETKGLRVFLEMQNTLCFNPEPFKSSGETKKIG